MKRTAVLCAQHIGRRIKWHWHVQGKIHVFRTGTEEILKSRGFDVIDVHEYLNPPKPKERIVINGLYDREIPLDKNHPDYKSRPCYELRDENVLVEGLEQAKVLTNTVEFTGLPETLEQLEEKVNVPEGIHDDLKKRIMLCCVFEATQEKLPKRKDPLRPAWNFPRDYGIPDTRKNELMCKNLVMICDQYGIGKDHSVVTDAFFSLPLKAHNKFIQFNLTSELVVTSPNRIKPFANPSCTFEQNLPNLYPACCTIGLKPTHFYTMENVYPFSIESKYPYIRTAFLHFNHTKTTNEYETPVTETQILGRTLTKGFTLAATQALALYGNDVVDLPEPVTVPVIHTDARMFHFGVYQLNTLALDNGSKLKNIFWNLPRIPLYEVCSYVKARPTLTDYNEDVLKKIITFLSLQ